MIKGMEKENKPGSNMTWKRKTKKSFELDVPTFFIFSFFSAALLQHFLFIIS